MRRGANRLCSPMVMGASCRLADWLGVFAIAARSMCRQMCCNDEIAVSELGGSALAPVDSIAGMGTPEAFITSSD